jgi:hypothetical protein
LKYAKHHHPIEIKTGSFWGQNRPLKADGSHMVIRIKTDSSHPPKGLRLGWKISVDEGNLLF